MHAFTFKGNADSFKGFTYEKIETGDHDKQRFEAVGLENSLRMKSQAMMTLNRVSNSYAAIIAGVRPENK